MFRYAVIAATLAAFVTTPALAQETRKPLPDSIQRLLGDNESRAIEMIANKMLELQVDGIITKDSLDNFQKSAIADGRAKIMQGLLAMDLDFDGSISPEELKIMRDTPPSRRNGRRMKRAELELFVVDADLDNNGTLDFDELRKHVIKRYNATNDRRRNRRHDWAFDLLALDLDGDGQLSIPEMARSIRAANQD